MTWSPPSALQPGADIPSAVDQLILKATHVNPYARFKAMFEVESAILDSLRSESRADLRPAASATMPSRGVRLHEPSSATVIGARPRRWLAWASAAVVVTALSAASIALLLGTPSPPESTRPKIVSVAVLPASIPEPQPPPPPPPPPATEAPEPEIAPAMIPEQDPSPASDDELPALDLKFVDKQLIKQTRAVSKCGLKDGLFPGMTITVTVNIDSDGKTVTTVANGGDHDHVKCIDKVMQRLALGPSKAGGRRTHKYTI
jgi:hypothetical protein